MVWKVQPCVMKPSSSKPLLLKTTARTPLCLNLLTQESVGGEDVEVLTAMLVDSKDMYSKTMSPHTLHT